MNRSDLSPERKLSIRAGKLPGRTATRGEPRLPSSRTPGRLDRVGKAARDAARGLQGSRLRMSGFTRMQRVLAFASVGLTAVSSAMILTGSFGPTASVRALATFEYLPVPLALLLMALAIAAACLSDGFGVLDRRTVAARYLGVLSALAGVALVTSFSIEPAVGLVIMLGLVVALTCSLAWSLAGHDVLADHCGARAVMWSGGLGITDSCRYTRPQWQPRLVGGSRGAQRLLPVGLHHVRGTRRPRTLAVAGSFCGEATPDPSFRGCGAAARTASPGLAICRPAPRMACNRKGHQPTWRRHVDWAPRCECRGAAVGLWLNQKAPAHEWHAPRGHRDCGGGGIQVRDPGNCTLLGVDTGSDVRCGRAGFRMGVGRSARWCTLALGSGTCGQRRLLAADPRAGS